VSATGPLGLLFKFKLWRIGGKNNIFFFGVCILFYFGDCIRGNIFSRMLNWRFLFSYYYVAITEMFSVIFIDFVTLTFLLGYLSSYYNHASFLQPIMTGIRSRPPPAQTMGNNDLDNSASSNRSSPNHQGKGCQQNNACPALVVSGIKGFAFIVF